jgi:hypothetical protein
MKVRMQAGKVKDRRERYKERGINWKNQNNKRLTRNQPVNVYHVV